MSELGEKIRDVVEGVPAAEFMKGRPQLIACGNSGSALEALRSVGASAATVDILPDPQLRRELRALCGWPTIQQLGEGVRRRRRRPCRRACGGIG